MTTQLLLAVTNGLNNGLNNGMFGNIIVENSCVSGIRISSCEPQDESDKEAYA